MKPKILITGPPRSGKSTLIANLIRYFTKKQISVIGFLTPEIRKGNRRIGFDIEEINTQKREKLARIGNFKSEYRLGRYAVYTDGLEKIISKLEKIQLTKDHLVIIDEIGKMELFSTKFQEFIEKLFSSNFLIIATIGINIKHPIKQHLLDLPDVLLFTIDHKNYQDIFQDIISLV